MSFWSLAAWAGTRNEEASLAALCERTGMQKDDELLRDIYIYITWRALDTAKTRRDVARLRREGEKRYQEKHFYKD